MIVVLKYSPAEDDAHLHGESRQVFDGMGVLGIYLDEETANEAIAEDVLEANVVGREYMIDDVFTAKRFTVVA